MRALFLSSVLTRLCPREDTTLSSVMIRPCLRDDKPLSSGERVKGFPRSRKKLCWRAVKVVGVILKRNDTDVGWWRWVKKGVSRFCHTPSALRARPPVSGGQSKCGRFFLLCPSKLGGRGAERRRGYASFPFPVFRFPFSVSRFPFLVFRFRFRSLLYHTPSALWARPPVSRGQSGWPVSFIATK